MLSEEQHPASVDLRIAGWVFALLSNSRLVTAFNLPLAVVPGWLLWRSLDWLWVWRCHDFSLASIGGGAPLA
jgi:hypothetical protein